MTEALHSQLSDVEVALNRPLLITDADEVLFAFMRGFERHLANNGAYFNWASFRLNGNIIARDSDDPLEIPQVRGLLRSYFEEHTQTMDVVEHAPEMLQHLSRRLQVVVLSNVPHAQRADRAAALHNNGMPFPIISNEGSKADAVETLAARTAAPVFFIDDSPNHHDEVKRVADHVVRIHYISDPRLSTLLGPADASHYRARDWLDIRAFIEDHLDQAGQTDGA
ncbi:MAG: hypothetical protein P8Q36_03080 [Alphaproteobacteria bacterium]|nr:hypothetical protein [Rhodospirillaceae bacterium]MBT6509115.1 hypothetical protein [Rhodospirillaceae bacterium]MBT7614515.1 hypothetical protein [Rhodospirillaceae bacterium]MBT7648730.1 hypothetical protein [Rhodospirillaceae bacterium]MDG2479840.1 hypothetical protein [Alphaproteobacteria bacterium]